MRSDPQTHKYLGLSRPLSRSSWGGQDFSVLPFAHFPFPWDVLIPFLGMFSPNSSGCFNPIPQDDFPQFLRMFSPNSLGYFPLIPRDVLAPFSGIFPPKSPAGILFIFSPDLPKFRDSTLLLSNPNLSFGSRFIAAVRRNAESLLIP